MWSYICGLIYVVLYVTISLQKITIFFVKNYNFFVKSGEVCSTEVALQPYEPTTMDGSNLETLFLDTKQFIMKDPFSKAIWAASSSSWRIRLVRLFSRAASSSLWRIRSLWKIHLLSWFAFKRQEGFVWKNDFVSNFFVKWLCKEGFGKVISDFFNICHTKWCIQNDPYKMMHTKWCIQNDAYKMMRTKWCIQNDAYTMVQVIWDGSVLQSKMFPLYKKVKLLLYAALHHLLIMKVLILNLVRTSEKPRDAYCVSQTNVMLFCHCCLFAICSYSVGSCMLLESWVVKSRVVSMLERSFARIAHVR